jgi:hypothetical protein
MNSDPGYLPRLASRENYVDFLEGYVLPTVEEAEARRASRKLVKTYLLETVGHGPERNVTEAFPGNVQLDRLDDSMFRVLDASHGERIVGLLELLDDRHPVLYTTLGVKESDRWIRQNVDSTPWLDRMWLSSPMLFELWQYVQRTTPSHRYVRLGFEHEAWYEASTDVDAAGDDLDEGVDDEDDDFEEDEDNAGQASIERRRSKVNLTERLSVLKNKLPQLIRLYDPLHSLVQLQMPSAGRGGHLLHFDGKATNRSESFLEHRATMQLIVGLYRRVTENAEEHLWLATSDAGDDGFRISGAPLSIRYSEPLSQATFDRFVNLGLQRKTSRFRIGGYAQRRGPTKVQLAAIDRHLWQPFLLEATSQQLLAVLPHGTCGNSIHRLVTNVQRYVDPEIKVWLGSEPYEAAVASALGDAA